MTLAETLLSVWEQVMLEEKDRVRLGGEEYRVESSLRKKLRTVDFDYAGRHFTGIEQNPQTQSVWARMARQGKRIMQFRCEGRYLGNVAEARLTRYPAWQNLSLPE
jgi:hypothetical protein